MTIDFEENILRYFVTPENKAAKFIKILDDKVFDVIEHQIVMALLKGFINEYRGVPTKADFVEYSTVQIDKNNFDEELRKPVLRFIKKGLFTPTEASNKFLRETIIEHCQYKLTRNLFKEYGDKLQDGSAIFKEIKRQLTEIVGMTADEINVVQFRGGSILENGGVLGNKNVKVLYSPYEGLNNTMGAKGVCPPELIVIMSGSKAFKTGVLINLAVGFARKGYKVYYADGENGYRSISSRVRQCFCECTKYEVIEDEFNDRSIDLTVSEMFDAISKEVLKAGGDFVIDSFAPSTATISDVEDSLEKYKQEKGFIPDIIFWDAIEHFLPSKDQGADYLNSQRVIKDVIGLNIKLDCASVTPAQVKQTSLGKDIYKISDIGRDYGVIRYAHTVLSILRNEDEEKAGLAQLYSVVQREGKSRVGCCMLKLDEENMQAVEISFGEAADILGCDEESYRNNIKKTKKKVSREVRKARLKAENVNDD